MGREASRQARQGGRGRGVVVGAPGATLDRRATPTRTCVQCRHTKDKRELLRVVRTPAGEVIYDATGKANGRGAYVCHDEGCLVGAFEKGGLRRALEVDVPAGLAADLRRIVSRGTFDGAE